MKKTLSLLLVLAMVLSSFSFAFATEAEKTPGEVLKDLGVLAGNAQGDLMLEKELSRQDMIVLLSRLLGAENEAKAFEGKTSFKDVKDPYYVPFMAWAEANELTKGVGEGLFGFGRPVTEKEVANFMLRALGYTDVKWEDVAAKAVELGLVAKDADLDVDCVRGIMAEITLKALNTKVKDSDKTLAEKLALEMPVYELAVKDVTVNTAKSFLVKFNKAVEDTSKIEFSVKRGGTEVKVTAKWNEAKTEATLESSAKLPIGDYKVVVNDKTAAEAKELVSKELKVEKEKMVEVVFNSDTINRLDDIKGIVGFKVMNQYGEDITNSGLTRNINWVSSTNKGIVVDYSNGTLTVQHGDENTPGNQLVNLKNVVITGTDYSTGFSVTKTFEVSLLRGSIGEVKINGLVDKNGKEVSFVANQAEAYYLDVEVYDMSGNRITSNQILGDESIFKVHSSNPTAVKIITEEKDGKTQFRVQTIGTQTYDMPVVFTAVSMYTGKTATYNTTLAKSRKLEKFTLLYPDKELVAGETVEIPFEAYDQNGNKMTRFSEIVNKVTYSIPVHEKQDSNGNYRLFVTAGAANTMFFMTANVKDTASFSQISLTVREGNEPVKLNNIAFTDSLQIGAKVWLGFDAANVDIVPEVKDKYDRDMSLFYRDEYVGARYFVKVDSLNEDIVDVNDEDQQIALDNDVEITAKDAGVATVNLTLYKRADGKDIKLDTKSMTMIVVEDKDIIGVEVSNLKGDIYNLEKLGTLKDATDFAKQYGTTLYVSGLLANGGSVILRDGAVADVVANHPSYALGAPGSYVSAKANIGTSATAKATVTAYIYSEYGTLLAGSTELNTISDVPVNNKIAVKYETSALSYRIVEGRVVDDSRTNDTINNIKVNKEIDEIKLTAEDIDGKSIFEFATNGTKTDAGNKAPFWFRVSNQYGNGGFVSRVIVQPKGEVTGIFTVDSITGEVTATGTGTYLVTVSTNNGGTKTVTVELQ